MGRCDETGHDTVRYDIAARRGEAKWTPHKRSSVDTFETLKRLFVCSFIGVPFALLVFRKRVILRCTCIPDVQDREEGGTEGRREGGVRKPLSLGPRLLP